jgi:uncharacterized glyoxalase superfamily protein PhnB
MALNALNNEINGLRDAAAAEMRKFQADREAVNADPNLSPSGRQAILDEAREEVQASLDALHARERKAISTSLESLERTLHARLGDTGADILAMRDAEERADSLDEQSDAVRAITRALRSDDKSLAYAVIRRANEEGWSEVLDIAAEAHPSAAEALRDIRDLTRFRDDLTQGLYRTMSYSLGRP